MMLAHQSSQYALGADSLRNAIASGFTASEDSAHHSYFGQDSAEVSLVYSGG